MAETIEDYKKQVSVLEQKLSLYEKDATIRGYYALNKVVNQQIDILNSFELDTEIKKTTKDDKYFDRTKSVWEGLKSMISDLLALKSELRISGNQDKDEKNVPIIEKFAVTRN